MPKRKLRNCSRCGVRHGPPTGKYCKKIEDVFEAKNEEMGASGGAGSDAETGSVKSASRKNSVERASIREKTTGAIKPDDGAELSRKFEKNLDYFEKIDPTIGMVGGCRQQPASQGRPVTSSITQPGGRQEQAEFQHGRLPEMHSSFFTTMKDNASSYVGAPSGANPPFQFQAQAREYAEAHSRAQQAQQQARYNAESYPSHRAGHSPDPYGYPTVGGYQAGDSPNPRGTMLERMDQMENLMGKMVGVYQATMERFAHLAILPQPQAQAVNTQPPPAAGAANYHAPSPPHQPTPAQTPTVTTPAEKHEADEAKTPSESDSDEEDTEWKAYHGIEMWKAVKEKMKKNPFCHATYLKRGESVESFEDIMMVTFKTMHQLLEMKQNVSGLVKHGLTLAEKASKHVFESIAFVQYDESVRERAGEVGPSAFSSVVQEDALRFFSAENMKQKKQGSKSGSQGARKRSDKTCLRYNDTGCNAKNCYYVHKCVACDGEGHAKKDCKVAKAKNGK